MASVYNHLFATVLVKHIQKTHRSTGTHEGQFLFATACHSNTQLAYQWLFCYSNNKAELTTYCSHATLTLSRCNKRKNPVRLKGF